MINRSWAIVLCLLFLCAGRASADGGFTLGIEAESIFSQDLQIYQSPTITRTRTDLTTGLSTIQSVPYFSQSSAVNGTTTTFVRAWQNLDASGAYTYMKGSYSTQYFEFIAKLGAANRLVRVREHQIGQTDAAGTTSITNDQTTFLSLAELPQGFAYSLELRGEPYEGDSFRIMTGIHLSQMINKATMRDDSQTIFTSSTNITQQLIHSQNRVDYDEINYGFSIIGAIKTEHLVPYLGLYYNDGRYKITNTNLTVTQNLDKNGAFQAGSTSVLDTVSYVLTPKLQKLVLFKAKASLVIGLNFPFENGGITLEGKYQGQSSITLSGHVGF